MTPPLEAQVAKPAANFRPANAVQAATRRRRRAVSRNATAAVVDMVAVDTEVAVDAVDAVDAENAVVVTVVTAVVTDQETRR